MKQPALGRKVSELRLARGLTQGELAEKCKLSLRTIQRIESAEVNPRSYTIRQLFSALDYNYYDSVDVQRGTSFRRDKKRMVPTGKRGRNIKDLFNLKTNTMKKVSILAISAFAIVFAVSSILSNTSAQSASRVRKVIEKSNKVFIESFNRGDISTLVQMYSNDACLVGRGCGKAFIEDHYERESTLYRFVEIKITGIDVSDSLAIEKGDWKIQLLSGVYIEGEYISEWRLFEQGWLVTSESSAVRQ